MLKAWLYYEASTSRVSAFDQTLWALSRLGGLGAGAKNEMRGISPSNLERLKAHASL
jgi:hypothetical protein